MPCGASGVTAGRSTTRLSIVARTNFISCRLAPSIANPIGTPWPSVSRLRLTPCLPRSVGLRPVFSPPERCLGHRSIHTQPVPVDPVQFIKLLNASVPEFLKNARLNPFLKAVMGGGFGTQVRVLEGFPLTTRAEHIENGIGAATVGDAGPTAPKAVGVEPHRDERLQHSPEGIGNAEAGGRPVVGRTRTSALGWYGLFTHTSKYTGLFG